MVYGKREGVSGTDDMIASESVALDALGFTRIGDIGPGEAVVITLDGEIHVRQCADRPRLAPCIFAYVYLSRPDSLIDDVYVQGISSQLHWTRATVYLFIMIAPIAGTDYPRDWREFLDWFPTEMAATRVIECLR